MKLSDFQFVNKFLKENIGNYENLDVHIVSDDKNDVSFKSGKTIEIHSPTTVSKTLFNLIYRYCEDLISNPYKKDMFSISLVNSINDYVYYDCGFTNIELPVITSSKKIHFLSIIINDIIEPLLDKKIDRLPLLINDCAITDSCRIIKSYSDFFDLFNFKIQNVPYSYYPLILCNKSVENEASICSHILINELENSLGKESCSNAIKNILLDSEIFTHVINVLSIFKDDPKFVDDFISYIKLHAKMNDNEQEVFVSLIVAEYKKNKLMNKYAQNYNEDVRKQWTNWSTMLGIMEKQLGGYRGSRREVTKSMEEVDKNREKERNKIRRKRRKKTLNAEEALDIYRNQYDTNVSEPGVVFDKLLQDNRVWN